ncbi:MAG: recombinase family protein [Hydrogenophaga sp.]|uniref:recombinase family protein n=1 Tax=Hydrogenophaga sp. TaxID=1904254 RepID=UPI002AB8BCD5|nr:recombinase family protein [Hydrogenophaga sp.]
MTFTFSQGTKMQYGYARVSTKHQETTVQLDALQAAGIKKIYQEKASSVGTRPQLQECLAQLKPGDVLVFYKLDRVARSLKDLLTIIERVEAAGACIRSLTEPLDTTSPMGSFVVQILGAVAQLERSITRQRTIAGQVSAIKRGVVFGRPLHLTPEQHDEARAMFRAGINRNQVARHFGVNRIVIERIWAEMHGRKKTGTYPVLKDFM